MISIKLPMVGVQRNFFWIKDTQSKQCFRLDKAVFKMMQRCFTACFDSALDQLKIIFKKLIL